VAQTLTTDPISMCYMVVMIISQC